MSEDLRARGPYSSTLCSAVFPQHTFAGEGNQKGKEE